MKEINDNLYRQLKSLGIINEPINNTRLYNIGDSNYATHIIQPWSIWLDWDLNPWDADIIKRVLRTKTNTSREEDYKKIIHICNERIRQINNEINNKSEIIDFENKL